MVSCSTYDFDDGQIDYACGSRKPYLKYCHIPALNGDDNEPHFSFSPYKYFTADTARQTCEEIGGKLPHLKNEHDDLWLIKSVEYLSSFVRFGWPYSLRWSSWPVKTEYCIIKSNAL